MKKFFAIYALPPSLVETPLFADQSEPARALENGHKIAVAQDGADVDLTVWAAKYAPRFQIVTALIKRAPEIFTSRVKGVKHHIICPNWGEHITGGVDSTGSFAVNASDLPQAGLPQITSGFVIKCMHNGCAGRDRLDHIAAMLADGTLAAEDLTNERFLLPEEPPIDISGLRTRAEIETEGASRSEGDKSNDWPPPRPSKPSGQLSAYGEAALDNAVRRIISAGSGEQEVTLNTETYCIGTLVGGGEIPESLGLDAMQWAARKMPSFDGYRPWRAAALETKVRKAFDDGVASPKAAPNG